MKPEDFQRQFGVKVKEFLDSPIGREFLNTLSQLRPGYDNNQLEHLFIENRGAIRGYETCLKNLISLSFSPAPSKEVDANYGVEEPKEK